MSGFFRILPCFLFINQIIIAQDSLNDSIKKDTTYHYPKYYYVDDLDSKIFPALSVFDTNLNRFQVYNPLYQEGHFVQHLGFIGLPHQSLYFIPTTTASFDFGFFSLDKYVINSKDIPYFNTPTPFTELFWVNGGKKEQVFKIFHTQNIKNINFGFNFRVIDAEGMYQRQNATIKNFTIFSSYKTKNERYKISANTTWNRFKIDENGGIYDDSYFEDTLIDRKIIPYRLGDAQRRVKDYSFYIKQSFDFHKKDTILFYHETNRIHRISHSFYYTRRNLIYEDNADTSDFYDNIFFYDNDTTYDSVHYKIYENHLFWASLKNKGINTLLRLQHQNIKLNLPTPLLNDFDIDTTNLFLYTRLSNGTSQKLFWSIDANYCIYGYNKNDFILNSNISYSLSHITNKPSISVSAKYQKKKPDFISLNYASNHFQWNNDFKQLELASAKVNYKLSHFLDVGITYTGIKNFVYYGFWALPWQLSTQLNIFQIYFYNNFKLKNFYFNNTTFYQYVDGADVLHLPELGTENTLYYNNFLFKKMLQFQIGATLFYFTQYYADSYCPAAGKFYLQQEKQIGNYPYIDVFLNLKIKRARIFGKIEHINSGLFGYSYYLVPHYPNADRTFKFGISWCFFE